MWSCYDKLTAQKIVRTAKIHLKKIYHYGIVLPFILSGFKKFWIHVT